MSALNMSIANTNERMPALPLKSISAMRLDLIMTSAIIHALQAI